MATAESPSRAFRSSISPKGQITLPASFRRQMGLRPKDRVLIELEDDGTISVRPASGLLRHYGIAGRLKTPMTWKEVKRIAHEDAALRAANEGLD